MTHHCSEADLVVAQGVRKNNDNEGGRGGPDRLKSNLNSLLRKHAWAGESGAEGAVCNSSPMSTAISFQQGGGAISYGDGRRDDGRLATNGAEPWNVS